MMLGLPLYFYFEAGAFLISAVVLYKFNNKPLHWFLPFLFLVVCTELLGLYYQKVLHKPNTWLYNITIPAEYIFYGLIIGSLCTLKSHKKLIYLLTVVYGCWAFINILFLQGYVNLATNNLKAGSIFMVITSAAGLLDLFRNDENKTLLKNPLFWICTGILFFNSGEFIYYFFIDILLNNKWDRFANVFGLINNKLIYVLYTCLSIAIVCSKMLEKKV
jgi:hypothetical protein